MTLCFRFKKMHENLQVQFGQYFLSVTVVKIIRYGLIAIIKEKKIFLKTFYLQNINDFNNYS